MATQSLTVQAGERAEKFWGMTVTEIEATGKTTDDLLVQMKATKQPIFLNYDEGETLVVLAASDYRRLIAEVELYETELAVEEGLEDIEQGRVYTLEEVDAEILQRFPFLTRAKEKAALANEQAK